MKLNDRFDMVSDEEGKKIIRKDIEAFLLRRHGTQSFRNKKEKLIDEATFLAGAMSALQVCFGSPDDETMTSVVPVIWVMNGMTGRSVLEEKDASK